MNYNGTKYFFDRAGYFYPIIMSYLINFHAIKEIALLGTLGTQRSWSVPDEKKRRHSDPNNESNAKNLRELAGPLSLKITGDNDRLNVPVDFVADELVINFDTLIQHQARFAMYALVLAYELTKDSEINTRNEKWEFLRHCRNAAGHNGNWHLWDIEPKRPARWRDLEITKSLHGKPLLNLGTNGGTLQLGDPVALLWDLEQD